MLPSQSMSVLCAGDRPLSASVGISYVFLDKSHENTQHASEEYAQEEVRGKWGEGPCVWIQSAFVHHSSDS